MANWTQEEIEKSYKDLLQKAVTDESFRKELLANPNEVIARETGKEVPADYKIRVVEDDPSYNATFFLPAFAGEELSEEDMQAMAGGMCTQNVCVGNVCGANASK